HENCGLTGAVPFAELPQRSRARTRRIGPRLPRIATSSSLHRRRAAFLGRVSYGKPRSPTLTELRPERGTRGNGSTLSARDLERPLRARRIDRADARACTAPARRSPRGGRARGCADE